MPATIHDICDSPLAVRELADLLARPLPDWFSNRQFPPPYTRQIAISLSALDIDHEARVEYTLPWHNPSVMADRTFESVFGLIIDMVGSLHHMSAHGPPYLLCAPSPLFRRLSRHLPSFLSRFHHSVSEQPICHVHFH